MSQKFLPYARQSISIDDCSSVVEALQADIITRGHYVEQFENEIAKFCKVKYAVSFNSGTTALHAAYYAANVNSSYRLITTPNTFAGTYIGAIQMGVNLTFVDIDRKTGNLDIEQIDSLLAKNNNVIVPVHFSGIPVDIDAIRSIAPKALIIEDAAHALGSFHKNDLPVGSCHASDMTVLSFHPAKTITTGEGGMVTTNNPAFFERLKLYRNNGIVRDNEGLNYPGYYTIQNTSGNYNFTDFQGALGLSQIKRINTFVDKRRQLVSLYRKRLENEKSINLFSQKYDAVSAHHLFVAQIDFVSYGTTRKEVMLKLREKMIGTQVHYIPAYHHPISPTSDRFDEMEKYYNQALTLPLYVDLDFDDVERICDELIKILKGDNNQ